MLELCCPFIPVQVFDGATAATKDSSESLRGIDENIIVASD